jgi:hypothetical protein
MDNLGMDDPASISDAGPDCRRGPLSAHSRALCALSTSCDVNEFSLSATPFA